MNRNADWFAGLTSVVQYRDRNLGGWTTMAAFDVPSVAENYASDCAGTSPHRPWEYRVVSVADGSIVNISRTEGGRP